MKQCMALSGAEIKELKQAFRARLSLAKDVFGVDAFLLDEGEDRKKLSAPLYDAVMVALDRLWERRAALKSRPRKVAGSLRAAIQKPKTYELVVARANTASATRGRIAAVERVLKAAVK